MRRGLSGRDHWEDGKVLETDSGDGCPGSGMYDTLDAHWNADFKMVLLYYVYFTIIEKAMRKRAQHAKLEPLIHPGGQLALLSLGC